MDACQFYLFGPPHLIRCAQPLAISRRKQWGLLAYLLLTRQSHERDALAALLWPTYTQSHARADLRRELARLRHILPDVIACSHTEVALQPGAPLWVDVWAFEEHLAAVKTHEHPPGTWCAGCHEHLRAARTLYTGDLLAAYTLADSPGFEEWHFFQQESLRGELLDILSLLAAMEMAGGRLADAIAPLRARLAIDPLHEESHRRLIWLYTHTGQRAAALRQFGECKAVLARELGVEPAPETTALYQQLKLLVPSPAPAQTSPQTSPPTPALGASRDRLPAGSAGRCFVGRQRQLAVMAAHLDAACAGSGSVLFVSGEVGAGKTALLAEFSSQALAQHADLAVTVGRATVPDPAALPLLPFRSAIAMLAGDFAAQGVEWQPPDPQVARLRALFPRVLHTLVTAGPHLAGSFVAADRLLEAARAAYLEDTGDYARLGALAAAALASPLANGTAGATAGGTNAAGQELDRIVFAEAAAVLEELARHQPLLLLLDDFHWADAASFNLLFHLGKRLRTQPILIVCAYRPAELAPTGLALAAPTRHPLQALIHEFTRDFGPVQLDLDAAAPAEDLAWIEALLAAQGYPPSGVLRDALYARTQGQPLFAVDLLESWRAHGWLAHAGDRTGLAQHGRELDVVPPRSAAAVQRRIDRLSDDAAHLLKAAAAEGESFSLPTLAAALGWSERRALEILAGALHHRHHLVVEAGPAAPLAGDSPDATPPGPPPMRYRFANPMIRSCLYGGLDAGERLLLAGKVSAVGTPLGTPSGTQGGRMAPILEPGRADSQVTLTQSIQPFCPLAVMTPSQRSVSMYHRWHLNYPILILILAILLAVWAVSYTIATTPGFNIASLWQGAPAAAPITRVDMVEVAPGLYVPRDYYTQEKTYRAPVVLVLAPGYQVPQDYFVQEKTYQEPAVVTLAPGFKVPLGYYIQEKTFREPALAPATVEVSPGFKVPQDYYIQEKMYRAAPAQ